MNGFREGEGYRPCVSTGARKTPPKGSPVPKKPTVAELDRLRVRVAALRSFAERVRARSDAGFPCDEFMAEVSDEARNVLVDDDLTALAV